MSSSWSYRHRQFHARVCNHEIAASRVANLISLAAIADEYEDDAYGRDDSWVDDLPDLGENA
jgi:hypothetical protein